MITSLKRRCIAWLADRMVVWRKGPPQPLVLIPSDGVRRLTLIKLDRIGDFILATGFLRLLAERSAGIAITLVVRKPLGGLARQQFPDWQIIELPARGQAFGSVFFQRDIRRQLRSLPESDLLIDLRAYRDYADTIYTSWVPARCKVAIANAYPPALGWAVSAHESLVYDHFVQSLQPQHGESRDLANHRSLAAAIFQEPVDALQIRPRLALSAEAERSTAARLEELAGIGLGSPYLVVCPGASSPAREYPPAKLACALRGALGACASLPIIVAGTNEDSRTTVPLLAALKGGGNIFDATGVFSLNQHLALIAGARFLLSMETCHVHIGGAFGTPSVCIVGGGHFGEFGPWGESPTFRWVARPMECFHCNWQCIHQCVRCIAEIPQEQITESIAQVLESAPPA